MPAATQIACARERPMPKIAVSAMLGVLVVRDVDACNTGHERFFPAEPEIIAMIRQGAYQP